MLHLITSALSRLRRQSRPGQRVRVRLLNDATDCRSDAAAEVVHLEALATEVSRAGMHLLLNHPLKCHTLLAVERPGAAGQPSHAVLARVVQSMSRPNGLWDVACSLAAGLAEEDVLAFGAGSGWPPAADRRARRRSRWQRPISFRSVRPPEQEERVATAIDISPQGVGLVVTQPLGVGTLVSLGLLAQEGRAPLDVLANVVRTAGPVAGRWTLGCHFIWELTDDEMQTLSP